VIGSKIVFIKFSMLNIICEPIRIVHLSCLPVHVQIRCVPKCSPILKSSLRMQTRRIEKSGTCFVGLITLFSFEHYT
jgi:hypothetical protein